MVTDILAKDTDLYVAGDAGPLEQRVRHRGQRRRDPAARRDEPQEAGRTEGPCGAVNLGRVDDMALRKQKSRKQQVTDLAIDYLKLKTAGKAAKGAGKGAKKAAKGTAVYKVAQEDADREADSGHRRRRRGRARGDEGRQGPRRRRQPAT